MTEPAARSDVRMAELLAVLSLAADLGMSHLFAANHALIGDEPGTSGAGAPEAGQPGRSR